MSNLIQKIVAASNKKTSSSPSPASLFKGDKYSALSSIDRSDESSSSLLAAAVPSITNLFDQEDDPPPSDSLLSPPPQDWLNPVPPVTPVTAQQFLDIVNEVRLAIADGIYPVRISQGSSGSYFCKSRAGHIVGVFKPKNEEPYGHLNPKWTKWIHKNLFPCCFGRSCLIPNLGYISEAAASYIDRRLQLNVCPRTEVVSLSSPSFYYSTTDCKNYRNCGIPLPPKMGSFQLFLNGYKDATTFFREGYDHVYRNAMAVSVASSSASSSSVIADTCDRSDAALASSSTQALLTSPENPVNWTGQSQREFQMGFERLVVLDYMIRNTDRGSDNWMIRFNCPADDAGCGGGGGGGYSDPFLPPSPLSPPSPPLESSVVVVTTTTTADGSILASRRSPFAGTNVVDGDCVSASASAATVGVVDDHITHAQNSSNEVLNDRYTHFTNIQVSAIDNGLAFPYKHPDRWRSYPYGWSSLPISRLPFSASTRTQVLHLLTSAEWWATTLAGLERLFRLDPDFSESMWRRQGAVIRGQGYNLVEVLGGAGGGVAGGSSPAGMLRRPVVAVFDDDDDDEGIEIGGGGGGGGDGGIGRLIRRVRRRFETFTMEQPCFSWC